MPQTAHRTKPSGQVEVHKEPGDAKGPEVRITPRVWGFLQLSSMAQARRHKGEKVTPAIRFLTASWHPNGGCICEINTGQLNLVGFVV